MKIWVEIQVFRKKKCHLVPSFNKIDRLGVANRTINATSQVAYVSAPSISSDTVQYFRGDIVAQSAFKSFASTWWQKITIAAVNTLQDVSWNSVQGGIFWRKTWIPTQIFII